MCVCWANVIETLSDLLPHMNDILVIHNWTIFRQDVQYIKQKQFLISHNSKFAIQKIEVEQSKKNETFYYRI